MVINSKIKSFINPQNPNVITSKQESYLKMSLSTVTFLMANARATSALPNFDTYFTAIQATNAQIQATQELQEIDKTGITKNKNQLRVNLIAPAIDVARRMVAYVTNAKNLILLAEVSYTESDLKRSSDTELKSRCQVIYDCATANLDSLETYGIVATNTENLLSAITDFNGTFPKGRVGTTDTEKATEQLVTLFKTLSDNYTNIDTLVEMVRVSHASFYNEYKNLRKVIGAGIGSMVLKAKVTDGQTGDPLANATIVFTPINGQLKAMAKSSTKNNIVKKTAKGGGANIKSMPDGTYDVITTRPGYKDQNATVSVVNGEMAVLEIVLEKA